VTTLQRPQFLAIVSSATLAMTLARKSIGRVDGFVVEGSTAGGHNAPPRGGIALDPAGEPIYGPRDAPNLEQIRALGLPFWLAGSLGGPGKLQEAIALGAQGIQVGTAFALCEESGMEPALRRSVCDAIRDGSARVFTDPRASPTGFPFKVLRHPGTASEAAVVAAREPMCDLGYLRQAYREANGTVGFRCPGEPLDDYLRKGGTADEAVGRKCVCNGLLATVGLPQTRHSGAVEPPLVTAGNDLEVIRTLLKQGSKGYSAGDVLDHLLGTGREQSVAAS
jgi:nitronate monooxygenase